MKFQIKNRYSDEILIEGEAKNFKEFIEKNNADLYNANLSKADLYNANLYNADLYNAKIKITQKDELLKALNIEILE